MLGGFTLKNLSLTTVGNLKPMAPKGEGRIPNDKDSLWCDYCHKPRHTHESCWKLHGKPPLGSKKGEW